MSAYQKVSGSISEAPRLHLEVSSGEILNPKFLLMVAPFVCMSLSSIKLQSPRNGIWDGPRDYYELCCG